MGFAYWIMVAVAGLFSLALCRGLIGWAPRVGLVDRPGERRIHQRPVARAGGLGIWLALMAGLHAGYLLLPGVAEDIGRSRLWGYTAATGILVAVGVADDRFGLRAWVKLGWQVAAVTVFCLIHEVADKTVFGFDLPNWAAVIFVLGWSVLIINAFNLIDGLDGLCGGLALISLVALGVLAASHSRVGEAFLLFAMAAGVGGFLYYNRHPARIFLGDAGSMLIGFTIATTATSAAGHRAVAGTLLLPFAVAGIPLLDVLLAVWRRSIRKVLRGLGQAVPGNLFTADSDHLHHRLLAKGFTGRRAAWLLQGSATLVCAIALCPLVLGERFVGVAVVGLLVVGLMSLRHFAHIELVQTGSLVHLVVRSSKRRRRYPLGMVIYDLSVLAGAFALAFLIESNRGTRETYDLTDAARLLVVYLMASTVALRLGRIYRRVWTRATLRDFAALFVWISAAAVAAAAFSIFFVDEEVSWSAVRIWGLTNLFAAVALALPRTLPELLRELAVDGGHRGFGIRTGNGGEELAVVFGAGNRGNLFIDYLRTANAEQFGRFRVAGFIDDNSSLRGRLVKGFPHLGGVDEIEAIVERHGIRAVIVAVANPPAERLAELEDRCAGLGLDVYRWDACLRPVSMSDQAEEISAFERKTA